MSRITILLFGKSGGGMPKPGGAARAMFEYANHLYDQGHEVNVLISAYNGHPHQHYYYDDPGQLGWSFWRLLEKRLSIRKRFWAFKVALIGKQRLRCAWFNLKPELYLVPTFEEKYIPEADAIIVLDWWMLLWARGYSPNKGRKFWFIHTIFFLPPTKKVGELMAMPFKKITVSNFMRQEIARAGGRDVAVVGNGVNLRQFNNFSKNFNRNKRICMVYFDMAPFKGVQDGIMAFEIARKQFPEIKLVMMGVERGRQAPKDCEFHWNPDQEKIKDIYSSCDIFLFPSRSEAFGIPPLEAMACRCAVVGTTAGGMLDYAVADETALLSSPGDIQSLARNLIRILGDEALLKRISGAGYSMVNAFSWEHQTHKLVKEIL